MREIKFNSQVCASVEQSKRLLELGLKPETADMCIDLYHEDKPFAINEDVDLSKQTEVIPAWSLHRLLLLCDVTTMFTRDILETAYDYQINVIENLIKNGYFNKEYLKR